MPEIPIFLIKLSDNDAKITNFLTIDDPIGANIKTWKIVNQADNGLIGSVIINQGNGTIMSPRLIKLYSNREPYGDLTLRGALGTLKYNEAGSFVDRNYISRTAIFIGYGSVLNGMFVKYKHKSQRG
jgi:hypothetical protein